MSDLEVRALGALPKGDANGLAAQAARLNKDRGATYVAIVLFTVPKVVTDDDKDAITLVPKVRQVELVTLAVDAAVVHRALMRSYEERTGQTTLPFELEIDVNRAFDALDPDAIAREIEAELRERQTMADRAAAEPERAETVGLDERCESCDWPLATSPPGEDCQTPQAHMNLPADTDPPEGGSVDGE
jgi:hypothetical protein